MIIVFFTIIFVIYEDGDSCNPPLFRGSANNTCCRKFRFGRTCEQFFQPKIPLLGSGCNCIRLQLYPPCIRLQNCCWKIRVLYLVTCIRLQKIPCFASGCLYPVAEKSVAVAAVSGCNVSGCNCIRLQLYGVVSRKGISCIRNCIRLQL